MDRKIMTYQLFEQMGQGWSEIEMDEFKQIQNELGLSTFKEEEVEMIDSFYKKFSRERFAKRGKRTFGISNISYYFKHDLTSIYGLMMDIRQCKDDWIVVARYEPVRPGEWTQAGYTAKYYKCDEFEGLLNLCEYLKNKALDKK